MEGFFIVTAHLFGGVCVGPDLKINIVYETEIEADSAVTILKELERITYETIEDVEPAERLATYIHLLEQILRLGLEAILPKMFEEEFEIGDIRMVKSSFKNLVFIK